MARRFTLGRVLVLCLASAGLVVFLTLLWLNLSAPPRQLSEVLEHRYSVSDRQFLHELGALLGPPVALGNDVQDLHNGVEIFPAMLEAIESAERTITFETYIYWSGEIGERFTRALVDRARAGVRVHVLIDWVGSQKMEAEKIQEMEDAGVEVRYYHPLRWYHLSRMNNRTHRKLLVVDGHVGFTGGVGIADEWLGDARNPDEWRELHFRVEGPVVAQMQGVFASNWTKTTGTVLQGEEYFPRPRLAGGMPAQMFSSSPTGGSESMHLMYLLSIASAERSIDLAASYFVPDELARESLVQAMERGVRVRILLPNEYIDAGVVRYASRAQWGELLEAGAEIREYQPTMFHVKMFIVDALLVSVGSTNFDARSFKLNDEANLNVYDAGFGARMVEVFERDLALGDPITLEEWRNRPLYQRVKDRVSSVLSPQL
ncbi:cardiolipin synthase [Alkalisalibacterium limincola]|uniref:Cardiolipin synthase n=1 Tax=Alkalisalibacterium limincola TaxID=2699169 RepID=A0A5C8KXY8_9GAMM|nr:cardiolipin synthase [Alkalisalibacterium limincola]TXK65647.1 cardiolipin synthase [Alkalisalibacterium limincola]